MTLDTATERDESTGGATAFGRRDDGAKGFAPREPRASGHDEFEDVDYEEADEEADEPAPRRRRSRAARRPSIIFLNFCMTLAILGAAVGYFGFRAVFNGPGPLERDATYTVARGATLTSIARDLQNRGMIANADLFKLGARTVGDDRGIQAGEFSIPAGASMASILDRLLNGSPVQFRVTIPEGLTVWQAAQRIDAHPELTGDLPATLPPEGWLAAETVQFQRGASKASVIEQLHAIQKRRVAEAFAARAPDSPVSSPEEMLTLASIVEKETALAAERPLVAGVFANRVRENWHLNTDPTLIYGVFGGRGLPDGRPILQSDKEDRNPYNTYIHRGLPPGPIAIPGKATLDAVANPADTDAMFFVADGTGGHAFSATMAEHNEHVAALRRRERERPATSSATSPSTTSPSTDPATTSPSTTALPVATETPSVVPAAPAGTPAVEVVATGGQAVTEAQAATGAAVTGSVTETTGPDEALPAPPPPGFVKDGIPAPGIPVPLMRPAR